MNRLGNQSFRVCLSSLAFLAFAHQAPCFGCDVSVPVLLRWGSYGQGPGQFSTERGVAVDDAGYIYVADYDNKRIEKFDAGGAFVCQWGAFGSADGEFVGPADIAADHLGNIYVRDDSYRIEEFTNAGAFLRSWTAIGSGVAAAPDNTVYGSVALGVVGHYTGDGVLLSSWTVADTTLVPQAQVVQGMTVDSNGNLLVTEWFPGRIIKFSPDGTPLANWNPAESPFPTWLVTDSHGNTFVSGSCIATYSSDGAFLTSWAVPLGPSAAHAAATAIAVDQNGSIFVLDLGSETVVKFGSPPTGASSMSWGQLKTRYR